MVEIEAIFALLKNLVEFIGYLAAIESGIGTLWGIATLLQMKGFKEYEMPTLVDALAPRAASDTS